MAIKKQKRTIEEADPSSSQNGALDKKFQKQPKKVKIEKSRDNGSSAKKSQKSEKKSPQIETAREPKKIKNQVQAAGVSAPETRNPKKVAKLARRNEKRKEEGQYKPEQITLSADEIEKRIELIRGRSEITKTAKRKIGILKKKLAILNGTFVPKAKQEVQVADVSKSERRHLRRKKSAEKRKALLAAGGVVTKKNTVESLKKKAGVAPPLAAAVKHIKLEKGAEKKGKARIDKKAKKLIIEKEEPEESDDEVEEEEEEEEDDDDDESGSEEETEESKAGILNTSEEQSEDDDDEEEDEDDEEDDEEEEEDDDDEDEEIKYALPAEKIKQEVEKKPFVKREIQKEQVANGEGGKKKRFVLFVGNLSYEATADDIKKHFLTKVSDVSSVRVPTKPGTNSPRGIAYVELTNETDYQKGLSLHNTNINGRRINVEYTQGGSKSVGNRSELVSKNKKLHAMRKGGMLAGKRDGRNDRRQKQKNP